MKNRRIALGADHNGVELKSHLKKKLKELGYQVYDAGTQGKGSVDYPDIAKKLGKWVQKGKVEFGVLICGTGIGMAMAANKLKGIRAATCNSLYEARMARKDNNANILTMGGRILAPAIAEEILQVFLETPFEGGRHERRVRKIHQMEEKEGKKS
ncbi:MAG: ribose 5-phosphate isomerase B [bacterium]